MDRFLFLAHVLTDTNDQCAPEADVQNLELWVLGLRKGSVFGIRL